MPLCWLLPFIFIYIERCITSWYYIMILHCDITSWYYIVILHRNISLLLNRIQLLRSTFVFMRHFGAKTISRHSHLKDGSSHHISRSDSLIWIDLTFVLFKHVILMWINYSVQTTRLVIIDVILSVVMLNVIMLSAVVPLKLHAQSQSIGEIGNSV